MAGDCLCSIKASLNIPNYLRYLLLNGAPNRALINGVSRWLVNTSPKTFKQDYNPFLAEPIPMTSYRGIPVDRSAAPVEPTLVIG
jgi:hypothetical protein